jgi:hypothetical protein
MCSVGFVDGSSLRSSRVLQVVAPPGYKFVGADVDSEELWIASGERHVCMGPSLS